MAAVHETPGADTNPGMLAPGDPRIPEPVRKQFDTHGSAVAKVVPVIGISHQEWWLFDDQDNLLDMVKLTP